MGRKACRDWRRKFVLRDFFVTSSPISKLANSFILSLNSKGRGRGSGGWCHSPHGRSWVFEFEYLWCKVCLRLAWTLTKCFIFVIYIFVTGCNGTETGQGRVKESQDRGPVRWIKEEEKSDAEVRLLYSSRCHWNQGKDSLWNQLVWLLSVSPSSIFVGGVICVGCKLLLDQGTKFEMYVPRNYQVFE